MGAFRDVVQDIELKELNLRGRKFTWSNDRTQMRIDRAFCSTNWDLMIPISDHFPLLIARNSTVQRYRAYRYESF